MESIPLTPHKRDPAWKHCEMFKSQDRVLLKCLYCFKIFKGGGIHRIKGHLACQKGNAATCLRVPSDVRLEMQQSLINSSGSSVKRRKKQQTPDHTDTVNGNGNGNGNDNELFDGNLYDVNTTTMHLVGNSLTPEPYYSFVNNNNNNNNNNNSNNETRDYSKRGKGKDKDKDAYALDVPVVAGLIGDKKGNNGDLHMAIGRFLYDIGAPLASVNSAYFQPMVEQIVSAGSGALQPSRHDLRGWILKNSVEQVKDDIQKVMATWSKTGCSVLLDQWNTEIGKPLLSVLVYCPERTVFLKSIDLSVVVNSSEALCEFIKQALEEIGEKNVLQVISCGDEQFITAGKSMAESFPNVYFSPCSAHSVDLILEDFAKIEWINSTIEQAKSITRFVYNQPVVVDMLRRFTLGNDIIETGSTKFATSFSTIKRMVDLKHNLQSMLISQDWLDCPYSKQVGGLEMFDIVSSQSFWASCDLIVNLTNPLLRVSGIVQIKKRPSMGYIYAAMYRAKEAIKKELVKTEEYMPYWNIIDRWWGQQWKNPLHAAGFFLNPKYYYSIVEGEMPSEIVSGMFDCIEKLVPDINVQDKIIKEINSYKSAAGDFSRKMAVRARDTLLPAEWWSTYGGSCPNLARLAVRILNQTCASTVYRQNEIPFGQIHDTSNSLERQRVKDLVFVQNNLRLKQLHDKQGEENSIEPISYDCISLVDDWVSCKEDGNGSSDWMTLEPTPVNPTTKLGPENDEYEDLGSGFDDLEIFNRGKEEVVC